MILQKVTNKFEELSLRTFLPFQKKYFKGVKGFYVWSRDTGLDNFVFKPQNPFPALSALLLKKRTAVLKSYIREVVGW